MKEEIRAHRGIVTGNTWGICRREKMRVFLTLVCKLAKINISLDEIRSSKRIKPI